MGVNPEASFLTNPEAGKGNILQRLASWATDHPYFDRVLSLVIVLVAVSMGVEAHVSVRATIHTESARPEVFRIFDVAFSIVFIVELALRIVAEGMRFLSKTNKKVWWNIFDSALVLQSILDEIFTLAFSSSDTGLPQLDLLRMLRLVRLLRLIRLMRTFTDLRVMVSGILCCVKPLVWACVLLGLIMYMFAVFIMDVSGTALTEVAGRGGDPASHDLFLLYGGLGSTMLTLLMSTTGGLDWGDALSPLQEISWVCSILFSLYVVFSILCCFNIVTGVFVESSSKITQQDEDYMLLKEMEQRAFWKQKVSELFGSVNHHKKAMRWPDFINAFRDVRTQALFNQLGINVHAISPESLWHLFDFDGSGGIDLDEFADAIEKLHGNARSFDLFRVESGTRSVAKKLQAMQVQISNIASYFEASPAHPPRVPPNQPPPEPPAVLERGPFFRLPLPPPPSMKPT